MQEVKEKAKECLVAALQTGELEKAIGRSQTPEEEVKEKAKECLVIALQSGELEKALVEPRELQDEKAKAMREVKEKAKECLIKGFTNGDLEKALGGADGNTSAAAEETMAPNVEVAPAAAVVAIPSAPARPRPPSGEAPSGRRRPSCKARVLCASAPPPEASVEAPGATSLAITAVSRKDRRIGELSAMIAETKRRISEREVLCSELEEQTLIVRRSALGLEEEVKSQKDLMDLAVRTQLGLQDSHSQLQQDLKARCQKLRHLQIEMNTEPWPPGSDTARSQLSTAATSAFNNTGSSWGFSTQLSMSPSPPPPKS